MPWDIKEKPHKYINNSVIIVFPVPGGPLNIDPLE
jgi:hypothetical protein